MVEFTIKDMTRFVSYDFLVFAFFIALKPANTVNFYGLDGFLPDYSLETIIEWSPMFIGIFTFIYAGGTGGLPRNLSELLIKWIIALFAGLTTFRGGKYVRLLLKLPYCADYIQELPSIEKEPLTCENPTEMATQKSLIHYTRETPTKHETFVSTNPELELCYEKDIETLGGKVKEVQKANGQKVNEWIPDRKTEPIKREYIPLKERTRTLNDIRHLDSTADRETVFKMIRSYKQDQTTEKHIQEVIEDLVDW